MPTDATMERPSHISAATWWKLRRWSNRMRGRYGVPLYLVGSALREDNPDPRDWDVRMMLPDEDFALRFGPVDEWRDEGCTGNWTRTRFRWSDQCTKDTKDAVAWTQLNVDFQIYPESHADTLYADKPRVRVDSFPEDEPAPAVPTGEPTEDDAAAEVRAMSASAAQSFLDFEARLSCPTCGAARNATDFAPPTGPATAETTEGRAPRAVERVEGGMTREAFLHALRNYETVACALDHLGAGELADAEEWVVRHFDALLAALTAERAARASAEALLREVVAYLIRAEHSADCGERAEWVKPCTCGLTELRTALAPFRAHLTGGGQ